MIVSLQTMFNSARRKYTINTCRPCCVALVDQVLNNLFKKMMLVLFAGISLCTLAGVYGQGDIPGNYVYLIIKLKLVVS